MSNAVEMSSSARGPLRNKKSTMPTGRPAAAGWRTLFLTEPASLPSRPAVHSPLSSITPPPFLA